MSYGFILCEGETDQILIGSYLCGRKNWQYHSSDENSLFYGERINEYIREQDHLGIWAVGGNNFKSAIKKVAQRQWLDSAISRVAVVTDHDDEEAETERLKDIILTLEKELHANIKLSDFKQYLNHWSNFVYTNSFEIQAEMKLCYLLVPEKGQGALETFMLESLMNKTEEDKRVICQSKDFINHFQSDVYLKKRREKIKAELGVSMAIFNPDKIFTTMNELIQSVAWGDSEVSKEQFGLLEDF